MTKRILSIVLVAVMLATLLALGGCGASQKYEYSGISTVPSYQSVRETMSFVYEDTRLNINDDGTWNIDMELFLFIRSNVDEGTYTVEDGVYTFYGFEYGMNATGEKTTDGFKIRFADINDGVTPVIILFFDN